MHIQPAEVAALLALPGRTSLLGLSEHCEAGLAVECLYALAGAFSPNEDALLSSLLSDSTLRRRRQRGKLTPEESDKLVRIAMIWLMALDTFGDSAKARRFLLGDHPLLGGRRPLELGQASTAGAEAVEQLLGRLKYGSAA
jgi:putative toxin-antitoxin system antitoxin component (TIGR02293 family)